MNILHRLDTDNSVHLDPGKRTESFDRWRKPSHYCLWRTLGNTGVLDYSPVLLGLTHFFFHIWCVREISRESLNLARSIACIFHRKCNFVDPRWNVWHLKTLNLKYSNQPPRRALLEHLPAKWWWKVSGGNRHWCWKFMTFSEKRRWNFHRSRRPRHSWS